MRRKVGVYVKSRGAALIRGAATNTEFTVYTCNIYVIFIILTRSIIEQALETNSYECRPKQ